MTLATDIITILFLLIILGVIIYLFLRLLKSSKKIEENIPIKLQEEIENSNKIKKEILERDRRTREELRIKRAVEGNTDEENGFSGERESTIERGISNQSGKVEIDEQGRIRIPQSELQGIDVGRTETNKRNPEGTKRNPKTDWPKFE